jgi:SAM-dependent methyltransferase
VRTTKQDFAECPICGTVTKEFLAAGVKRVVPDRRCPKCTSLERHRSVWLFFQQRTNLFTEPVRMLHIAPEPATGPRVAALPNVQYLSADLDSDRAMVNFDLTDIPYPDGSFDAIFASHVLEHIPDDRRAMSEMCRVLAPGGWAVLLVPMFGPNTREDFTIVDPTERDRLFGQHDHVRMYGHDGEYERRLEEAGFEVTADYFVRGLDPAVARRYRLTEDELIHYCVKPRTSASAAPTSAARPRIMPVPSPDAPQSADGTPADQKSVVFFHVMKCGGTSVRAALAAGAAADDGDVPQAAGVSPAANSAGDAEVDVRRLGPRIFELDGETAKFAAGGTNRENWLFRDALLPYVLRAMHPAIVLGHFRYRDRYLELTGSAHFVTVLRDPVDRIVSLYRYRRYKAGIDVPVSLTFDEFLATPRWIKEGHVYVETFCGRDGLDPRSDLAIAAAVANLRRFAVVGFTERLDDFSTLVTEQTGKPVSVPMYNTSPAPEDEQVDDAMLERARAVCAPDTALYEEILARRG